MKRLTYLLACLLSVTIGVVAETNDAINNSTKYVNGLKLPAAYGFYDAEGTGHMLPIVASKSNQLIRYNDYSQEFTSKETINYSPSDSYTDYVRYYEDINRNGRIDIQLCYDGRTGNSGGQNKTSTLLVAGTTSYTTIEKALALPGMDLNQDGRTDYLYFNGNQNFIRYLQSDGSYREEYMQLMTIDEYMATYDPDQWLSTEARVSNGLVQPERSIGTVTLLNGGALGGFGCTTCTPAQRVFASQAVDINADGMIDLVDKQNGLMYFNMGDGKWVYVNVGGQLTLADFTNNGYQDILIPGDATKLLLYNTASRTYTETTLFSDLPADPEIYAYDFDRDGDTDILVTFSSSDNTSGFAYTMFFQNNGNGQFTQIEEQDYGESMLLFNNLQDIDGDGYYDLLAFDLLHYSELGTEYYYWSGKTLWLKGQNNLTFAAPQELFEQDGSTGFFDSKESSSKRINADDLNNDGFADIWVSGVYRGTTSDKYTHIYGMNSVAVANTAPTAPAKPELIYEDGILLVQWGNGSDAQTMTTDLTYALRIGTTSGGNDILNSHANADGKRRNYEDGNMGRAHSYTIDLRTYAPTTIYVSVQAVDAQHVGSAWSQEATVAHTSLPAMFTMSAASINLNDTLVLAFTPMVEGYTHTWQIEDGNLLPELTTASKESVLFTSGGTKHITHTLTAPNGQTASYTAVVQINPVGIKEVTTSDNISIATGIFGILLNSPFDFNFDGLLDGVYNGSTVYKGDANFTFTAQSGMWNSNNSFGSYYMLHDWDHNGALDIVFGTGDNKYYLPHNGTSTFKSKISDTNIEERLYNTGSNKRIYNFIDYTHNGNYDLLKANYNYAANPSLSECTMMIRGADGQYAEQAISGNVTNTQALYDICRKVYYYGSVGSYVDDAFVDMNHDGFTDLVTLPVTYVNNNPVSVSEVIVYLNKGNARFDQLNIPLAADIAVAAKTSDIKGIKWMDMNADGYLDIVAYTNNGVPYIMYNNANTSFGEPQIMPLGELESFYSSGKTTTDINYAVADIDHNGYPDIITIQEYTSSADKYGVYVHFRSAEDVTAQGFLMPIKGAVSYPDNLQTVYSNNRTYLMVNRKLYEIVAATNERPAAPSGVRAVQTNDGLLIEWNAAVDDHTPTILMQYNLSVKHAGQTGANAFVISPHNGLNANAAYLPGYDYISATQYLIPISALTVGDYEIQLQSIDGQKRMSEFSQPLTIHVDRQLIEAPTTVCVENEATISYAGASQTGTPVWNFDGGTIVSGTGFGPYHVQWTTAGMKTISLTLNEETAQRMILVDELNPDEDFVMPEYLFANSSTKVNIPANMRTAWYLHMGGMRYSVTEGGIGGFDKRMVIKDNIITLNPAKSAANELSNFVLALELELTNANGCTETYQQNLTILTADDIPQISLITPDAQAHNVITWDADLSAIFPQVRILKETNIYGQFVELTTLATTTATYTDLSSNSEQRAERYAIVGIMNGGIEAPTSTVHQTVHMTINRGMQEGTFNLLWNGYEGANIATYNILRGSSEMALSQIASVSASNRSYTDNAPLDAQPYYAIEYVLGDQTASSVVRRATMTASLSGRSNIVNRAATRTVVYATGITIYSANDQYATTADKPSLFLYAEFLPVNTTYKTVQWSIDGNSPLATIDPNSGLLTAKAPNVGGTVTVRATASDGSGVSATRIITIAPIADDEPLTPVYYTIRFLNYDGAVLQSSQVLEGEMPNYNGATPTKPEDDNYTYEFNGWAPTIVAAVADADYTAQFTATEKTQPKDYTPTGLIASQEDTIVWLDWNAVEGVPLYEWEFLYNNQSLGGDITSELYGGLRFENYPAGSYPLVCRVRSLDSNQAPLSLWASVNFTLVITNEQGLEDIVVNTDSTQKVMINGQILILRGEKVYTITGQEVK
jgi:hypothetical protein